jgi:hypothetical protein
MNMPNTDQPQKIGIWGPSRSGKTTYLAMLDYAFKMNKEWDIYANDEVSTSFLEAARNALFHNGRFMPNTTHAKTYSYTIHYRPNDQRYILEILDAPGELFERYLDPDSRNHPAQVIATNANTETDLTPQQLIDQLVNYDYLLFFIDPGLQADKRPPYYLLIPQLLESLRRYVREQGVAFKRVALCLTKVDADDQYWNDHVSANSGSTCFLNPNDHREDTYCQDSCHVYRLLKKDTMTHIRSTAEYEPNTQLFKCFLISSVGRIDKTPNVGVGKKWLRQKTPLPQYITTSSPEFTQEREVIHVQMSYSPDAIKNPRELKPTGLIEPLKWLLSI